MGFELSRAEVQEIVREELCRRAGLVKLGHVALDGTKVKANASKHKAMSYGHMQEREAQLAAEVAELLERAREVDKEEEVLLGSP